MVPLSKKGKSVLKSISNLENLNTQLENGTSTQGTSLDLENSRDASRSRAASYKTQDNHSAKQPISNVPSSVRIDGADRDPLGADGARPENLQSPLRDLLKEHTALKPVRKRHTTTRHAHLSEVDDMTSLMKSFIKAAKRVVSEASDPQVDEKTQRHLNSLLKKLRSKGGQVEQSARRLDALNEDLDDQEGKIKSLESQAFKIVEAIVLGDSYHDSDVKKSDSNEASESSVIETSDSEPIHPLLHQLYDTVGEAKLIGEEILNLQADFRLKKMFRESDKTVGINPSIPDTEFYLGYFEKRETLLQRFSDTKEAAFDFYARCIKEDLDVEEFELLPLDTHDKDEQESYRYEQPRFDQDVELRNRLYPMLLDLNFEPIRVEEWRIHLPRSWTLNQKTANHSRLTSDQNAAKYHNPKSRNVSRSPSTADRMAWEIVSSIKSDRDGKGDLRSSPPPSRKSQATEFHGRSSRFFGAPVGDYYSEPDMSTPHISHHEHRRTRSVTPPLLSPF
jgi:hypothetical protein